MKDLKLIKIVDMGLELNLTLSSYSRSCATYLLLLNRIVN